MITAGDDIFVSYVLCLTQAEKTKTKKNKDVVILFATKLITYADVYIILFFDVVLHIFDFE